MAGAIGYNHWFPHLPIIMEAERLNAIAASLADLAERTVELRGYL